MENFFGSNNNQEEAHAGFNPNVQPCMECTVEKAFIE